MGLLDAFNTDEGLLGLSLLAAAAPKRERTSIGEGLLQAFGAVQQRRDSREDRAQRQQQFGLQQQQLQIALDQTRRQAADQQRMDAWRDSIPGPQGQPLPAGPYTTAAADSQAANLPRLGAPDPSAQFMHGAMRAGAISPLQYMDSQRKDTSPIKLGAGEAMFGRDGKLLFSNAKDEKPSDLARLLEEMSALPPNDPRRATYQAQITKLTTHAPGTSVNIDRAPPGYRWEAPGKLGAIPGGPADKLPERQQNQVVGVQNLRDAIGEYRTQLGTHSKFDVLSPAARAEMGTKYKNMMLQAKEAYNLGVLNGPDMDVLQSVITDPMSLNGLATPRRSLDRQAAELDRIMTKIAGVASQVRPRGASPAAEPAASAAPGKVVNFSDLKD